MSFLEFLLCLHNPNYLFWLFSSQKHSSTSVEVSALNWSDKSTYQYPSCAGTKVKIASTLHMDVISSVSGIEGQIIPESDPCIKAAVEKAQNTSHPHQWDLVVGADVVWLEELVPPLVCALTALCGPDTELLLSHQKRSEHTDRLLFSSLEKFFLMEEVSHLLSQ